MDSHREEEDLEAERREEEKPLDRYNAAYVILWILGLGMLFPWNAFITAADYYKFRFCHTDYQSSFLNYFGIAFNLSNTIGLLVSLWCQTRVSARQRVVWPLALNGLVFLVMTILTLVSASGGSVFSITILCVLASGFCNALLQGGIFGMASRLPPVYMQGIMAGQGLAGLVVSLSSILTTVARASTDQDICLSDYGSLKWSAFAYFMIATLILFGCIVGFGVLERLPFVRFYLRDASEPVLSDESKVRLASPVNGPPDMVVASAADQGKQRLLSAESYDVEPISGLQRVLRTAKSTRLLGFTVWLVFLVTLSIFPSVTAKIQSTKSNPSSRFFGDLFIPFSFLNFNLMDLVGRTAAGWKQFIPNTKRGHYTLLALSLLRLAFIPLFLFCNIVPSDGHRDILGAYFTNDAWPILFMIVFGFTNGYIASVTMMYGPSVVEGKEQETAGTLMVLWLTLGLTAGSLSSFGWLPIVDAA